MNSLRRWWLPMLLCASSLPMLAGAEDHADASQLRLSDRLRWVPMAGAATYSLYRGDGGGLWQLGGEVGATMLLTHGLKKAVNDTAWGERPDGGEHAFPSGHVSVACTGAAYLGERYGWQPAGPMYAVAAWVGYLRVEENRHRWRDVIAGCALAYGVSKLIVRPYRSHDLALVPVLDTDMIGLEISLRWR